MTHSIPPVYFGTCDECAASHKNLCSYRFFPFDYLWQRLAQGYVSSIPAPIGDIFLLRTTLLPNLRACGMIYIQILITLFIFPQPWSSCGYDSHQRWQRVSTSTSHDAHRHIYVGNINSIYTAVSKDYYSCAYILIRSSSNSLVSDRPLRQTTHGCGWL